MSTPRLSFTSHNDWFFACAAITRCRHATHVLCERRILDGSVIAEWDYSTGTGWMRAGLVTPIAVPATDGKALNLSEAAGGAGVPASRLLCLSNEELHQVFYTGLPYYDKVSVKLAMPVLPDATRVARGKAGKARYYFVEVGTGHRLCAVTLGVKAGKVVALTPLSIATGSYDGDWAEKIIIDKAVDWDNLDAYPASSMPEWAKAYIAKVKAKHAVKPGKADVKL